MDFLGPCVEEQHWCKAIDFLDEVPEALWPLSRSLRREPRSCSWMKMLIGRP